MPFSARYFPASITIRGNKAAPNKKSIMIMHDHFYWSFDVFSNYGFIDWKIERLIWIAFLKNDENDKCLIKKLPKDIVKHVMKFLGSSTVDFGDVLEVTDDKHDKKNRVIKL